MTTLNLVKKNPIILSETGGDAVATYALDAVDDYTTWHEQARLTITDVQPLDVITVTGVIVINVESDTTTGTDQSVVFARMRLFNETDGTEAYAGVYTTQVYRKFGDVIYGDDKALASFNRTFAVNGGMLTAGHDYSVRLEVKKERVVGTPTVAVSIIDASIFADSARVL